MSASKILEKLSRKGQSTTPLNQQKHINLQNDSSTNSSQKSLNRSLTPQDERVIDPVVARLKAARKAEREQKEKELREKKGLPPKKATSARPKTGSKPPRSPASDSSRASINRGMNSGKPARNGPPTRLSTTPPQSTQNRLNEKKPKMTFSQLMAKASGIDQSKMSIAIKQKTKSPEAPAVQKRKGPEPRKPAPNSANASKKGINEKAAARGDISRSAVKPYVEIAEKARAPLPTRKPSSALAAKLKHGDRAHTGSHARKNTNPDDSGDDGESDLDSFIASEDEEDIQDEPEYDRDEIWSIFNRGKKRSHYSYDDYDSDDMEATGAEILEEESRSKRNALLEDKREMEKEAKLAALKKARKMGKPRGQ